MFYALKTAPAAFLTLTEAKAHLRVTTTDDDALITGLIAAATAYLDGRSGVLNRALVAQDWYAYASGCSGSLRVDFGPVSAVSEVSAMVSGAYVALDASLYQIKREINGVTIKQKAGATWPTADDHPEAWRVTFTAGYGAASAVPGAIRAAALLLIGKLYKFAGNDAAVRRETVDGVGSTEYVTTDLVVRATDSAIDALLAPFRMV